MKNFIPEEHRSNTVSNIIVVAVGILLLAIMYYFKDIYANVMRILNSGLPFFIGIALALLELPVMRLVDGLLRKGLCKKKPHPKLCRVIATLFSMMVLIGIVVGFFYILLPQLITSVTRLVNAITVFVNQNGQLFESFLEEHGIMTFEGSEPTVLWNNIINQATEYMTVVFDSVKALYTSVYHVVFQVLIGFVASFYLLMENERFCARARKMTYALCSEKLADWLVRWAREAASIFSGFISGKVVDSLIIGVLCYIGMILIGLDYAVLISVIITITNLIPFFGPFIGAIPCTLILAMEDPFQALWFVIFIFVLQQLDGNVIGPLVLGDQVGLPAFWIMVSIVCGSALFGFAGMLLGVPVVALVYAMVKTYIEDRLTDKGKPADTQSYIREPEKHDKHLFSSFKRKKSEKTNG